MKEKLTDEQIVKALECCAVGRFACTEECTCFHPKRNLEISSCRFELIGEALELINRQKAEIEELILKLECLLCHATDGKLSKHTYDLKTMEINVTDAFNNSYNDGYNDGYTDGIKEFAERLEEKGIFLSDLSGTVINSTLAVRVEYIKKILKEMTEEKNDFKVKNLTSYNKMSNKNDFKISTERNEGEMKVTDCRKCEHCYRFSCGQNWFMGCKHPPYQGRWIKHIELCPKNKNDQTEKGGVQE